MPFFKAADDITSVSLGAKEYPVQDGVIEVADEDQDLFLAFGYEYGPAPVEKPKRKGKQVESEGEA